MSVEYALISEAEYNVSLQLEKSGQKIISTTQKEFEMIKERCKSLSGGDKVGEYLNKASERLVTAIKSDFKKNKTVSETVCLISRTKIYWSLTLDELEEKMQNGTYIIVGDDDSVYRTFAAFKKIVVAAEKSFE